MSAQDKQIKISLGVDTDSVAKSKRSIQEITQEINRLVAAARGAGSVFGGGGGISVGTATPGMGTSGRTVAQNRATPGGGVTGGLTDSLTKAVQNSASLFKGAAAGSKDAFKIMSDGLKDHVRTADNEIRRLQQSLQGLERTYDKLKTRQGSGRGGAITDAAVSQAQGQYFQTADQLDRARTQRQKFVKAQEDMEEASNPSFYNRVKNYFGIGQGKGAGANAGNSGMLNGAMQAMGLPRWAGPAGAIGAGLAVGSSIAQAGRTNEVANVQYGIDSPFFRLNAGAQLGQVYGGNAQSIRHGDMARAFAMHQLAKDPAMTSILGNDDLLKTRRAMATPTTLAGNMAKDGFFSGGWEWTKNKLGSGIGSLLGIGGGGAGTGAGTGGIGTMNVNQVARARMTNEEIALKSQQYQQALEAKMQMDPGFNDRINSFYSGANSNASLLRMGGMGGGNVNFHGTQVEQSGLIKARAAGLLRDPSELMGARAELAATAGRGFMGYGESILGPKTGGLSNVASILNVGAQFNGGQWKDLRRKGGGAGASGFLGDIQKMIGHGGVDVNAAVGLTGLGSSMMTGGNFTGGGGGVMSTLLAAGMTGSTGGDMRMARTLGAGVNSLGSVMNGSLDPLQMALNASAAMKAGGGKAPYSAIWAMERLDPAQRAEFERTGQVPPNLQAMGVTKQMLNTFMPTQTGTMFSRLPEGSMAGTSSGEALKRFKAAGGNYSYMKGWSRKRIESEAANLAPALQMAGGASTAEGALGSIRFQLASAGILKGGRGRGAHDTIKHNTTMAKAGGAAATMEFQDAAHNADDSGLMGDTYDKAYKDRNASEKARRDSQGGLAPGGDANAAIANVSAALTAFVSTLKRESGGFSGKAGAPR